MLEWLKRHCLLYTSLNNEWAELPEALPTKQASEITGINPQCFNEMVRKHKMYGIIIRGKQYCRKTELIAYLSEPIQLVKTKNIKNAGVKLKKM